LRQCSRVPLNLGLAVKDRLDEALYQHAHVYVGAAELDLGQLGF
jgi:hypothetical protein